MKGVVFAAVVVLMLAVAGSGGASGGWGSGVSFTNVVASLPTSGGGFPVPPGQTFPNPGTCRAGSLDSNHSESWIAVKPGTEDLIGNSKFFFDKYVKPLLIKKNVLPSEVESKSSSAAEAKVPMKGKKKAKGKRG